MSRIYKNTDSDMDSTTRSCGFEEISDLTMISTMLFSMVLAGSIHSVINSIPINNVIKALLRIVMFFVGLIGIFSFLTVAWNRSEGDLMGVFGRFLFAPIFVLWYSFEFFIAGRKLCPNKVNPTMKPLGVKR